MGSWSGSSLRSFLVWRGLEVGYCFPQTSAISLLPIAYALLKHTTTVIRTQALEEMEINELGHVLEVKLKTICGRISTIDHEFYNMTLLLFDWISCE
jgi:hypothetical protein